MKKRRSVSVPNQATQDHDIYSFISGWAMEENARLYDMIRMMETIGSGLPDSGCCSYRIDIAAASTVQARAA